MIHEIEPLRLDNHYENIPCDEDSRVFCFESEEFLAKMDGERIILPTASEFKKADRIDDLVYLFSIGDEKFYLHREGMVRGLTGFEKLNVRKIRGTASRKDCFAAATAYQLFTWYRDNKFCGRCGQHMHHLDNERGLVCPTCKMVIYPKILPAVIVAVVDGDRILVTKYAGRPYKGDALIAGFTEIGESAEETVAREVMEEVGLKVKNIKYYKSQPWGTDCDLLLGFFCQLDGDDTIKLDERELLTGEWIKREDFQPKDDGISLTSEMMRVFKEGNY